MEHVTLSNGVKMPILGYGVYQVTKEECEKCVLDALKVGYRAIDTAQSYFNEEEVGNAIAKSGIPREEIFLTTKVWVEHYGYENARKSVEESMRKLKTDYLDLVLLHQPFADAYGAYRALEEMYEEGKIRAIGISNFYVDRMVDFGITTTPLWICQRNMICAGVFPYFSAIPVITGLSNVPPLPSPNGAHASIWIPYLSAHSFNSLC